MQQLTVHNVLSCNYMVTLLAYHTTTSSTLTFITLVTFKYLTNANQEIHFD